MDIGLQVNASVPISVPEFLKENVTSYVRAINEYINELRKIGRKVPECPNRKGCPNLIRIASDLGLPYRALLQSAVRKRLDEGIAELGISVVFQSGVDVEAVTYEQLFEAGSKWRTEELSGKPKADQQLSNTRSVLRKFVGIVDVELGRAFEMRDMIGSEFEERFFERKRLVAESISILSTRRKFSTEIDRWQVYYQRLVKDSKLPPDFASAFKLVLERSGIPLQLLADNADVNYWRLLDWRDGEVTPCQQSFPLIERIEKVLGLTPKCLVKRINTSYSKRFSLTAYPEYITVGGKTIPIRSNKRTLSKLRRLVPYDFDKRTERERTEVVSWLYSNLLAPATSWRRSQKFATSAAAKFGMSELPPVIEEEWHDLATFKRGKVPPPGMQREGIWSSATESLRYNDLKSIFSPLTLPSDRCDPRVRGLGVSPDVLTLAMLTCPKVLHWRICWMGRRRHENYRLGESKESQDSEHDGKQGEKYSFRDSQMVENWGALLAPQTGWLRQRPDLAHHLRLIPSFIDETFIARAKTDWGKVCDEAYAYYVKLVVTIEEAAEELRDSFEPIMPILASENPIAALRLFAQNILKDKPEQYSSPFVAAKHMRNYLIVRLLSATALRSRNIRELTFREDNTGHLRREDNRWVIEIPFMNFKNWQSSFFGTKRKRENYRKILADTDGLYDHLEEYVKVHRPRLLAGTSSDIMIVSNPKRPFYSPSNFGANYSRLTMAYLAHNPYRGYSIPGVIPHGPHTVRDIVATHVIKHTGSYELAGYAIQDTAQTAREHYARFMPQDKIHLADQILNDGYLSY